MENESEKSDIRMSASASSLASLLGITVVALIYRFKKGWHPPGWEITKPKRKIGMGAIINGFWLIRFPYRTDENGKIVPQQSTKDGFIDLPKKFSRYAKKSPV